MKMFTPIPIVGKGQKKNNHPNQHPGFRQLLLDPKFQKNLEIVRLNTDSILVDLIYAESPRKILEIVMKKEDVPQDAGISGNYGKEICYAVDDDGRYSLVPSLGWEPKNIANNQAWELIDQELINVVKRIKTGKLSPLAYHMIKNQMDIKLMAKYVKLSRFRVRRHLKPSVFRRLENDVLMRYANIFEISVDQLSQVPEENDITSEPISN